jgi:hypothetical protein
VSNCLFVGIGSATPANLSAGVWTKVGNMAATATYKKNYYFDCPILFTGLYTTPAEVAATEADPGFVDAATNNFKVTNQNIIDDVVGDPRWLVD